MGMGMGWRAEKRTIEVYFREFEEVVEDDDSRKLFYALVLSATSTARLAVKMNIPELLEHLTSGFNRMESIVAKVVNERAKMYGREN